MMKNLPLITLLALAFNTQANTPVWVKDSSSFINDGEITLKRENGSDFNINLNQKNANRDSQGRTASIMVVGSGGGYSWAHGFQMADRTYYAYESELNIYVPFTKDVFESAFEFEVDEIFPISTTRSFVAQSGSITARGTAKCGNSSYTGSCSVTCSLSTGDSSSGSTECSTSYSQTTPNGHISARGSTRIIRTWDDKFSYHVGVDTYADGRFTIPATFSEQLGSYISAHSRRGWSTGTNCDDPDGSGNTCSYGNRSSSSVALDYFFTDDWHDTGIKVGGYDWTATSSDTGRYVVGDKVAELPFGFLTNLRLTKSTSQMFALNGGDLYGFSPGETPEVVMANTNEYPVKAIRITGVKNKNE